MVVEDRWYIEGDYPIDNLEKIKVLLPVWSYILATGAIL